MRIPCLVSTIGFGLSLAACTTSDTNVPDESEDIGTDSETDVTNSEDEPGLELTPELCDNSSNLQTIMEGLGNADSLGGSGSLNLNEDELPKLLASPTTPFYMVNLITYRERAVYPDGRETDLTGREANALYDPIPFITAIGGRVVYNAAVDNQIAGTEDVTWDDVAIVEYSCAIAFLAMMSNPDFQETSIHKDAGVEVTRVMFAELQPLPAPEDPDQSEAVVAVGTALSGRPPRRSQRAELPHWAPASGLGVEAPFWPGMEDSHFREPSIGDAAEARPGELVPLAATPQRV